MNIVLVPTAVAAVLATTAATAGGYAAPIIAVEPVAAAPILQPMRDWTGFYAGLQFGRVGMEGKPGCDKWENPKNNLGKLSSLCSLDESGAQYGVHIGYLRDFGRIVVGAELSYDKFKVKNIDLWGDGVVFPDANGDMLRAKLLAGYDAGRFLPYATAGVAKATLDFVDIDNYPHSGKDTAFGYGVGMKFMVSERFLMGVDWMTHEFDTTNGKADIDTLSLSASYRF